LTDNVFTPELVKILQGGTIQTETTGEEPNVVTKIVGYTPPAVDAADDLRGEVFDLCAYSAEYDAAGQIVKYEKITYPNCTGDPVVLNSEDGVFRAPEYTITSMPSNGQAPYTLAYVTELPAVS
jgi:hypothetical protein